MALGCSRVKANLIWLNCERKEARVALVCKKTSLKNYAIFVLQLRSQYCIFYFLIQADVDHKSKHGCTPLHLASLKGNKKCAESLVRYGADTEAKTSVRSIVILSS